jgi:hypothetical protein
MALRGYGWLGHSLRSFPRQPPPTFLRLPERPAFLYRSRKNVIYRKTLIYTKFPVPATTYTYIIAQNKNYVKKNLKISKKNSLKFWNILKYLKKRHSDFRKAQISP